MSGTGMLLIVEVIMADTLIHVPNIEEHDRRLAVVVDRRKQVNQKLNPKETRLCEREVEFIEHRLTTEEVKSSQDKVMVRAVLQSTAENVRSLSGIATHTCKYLPYLSSVPLPLIYLLRRQTSEDFSSFFSKCTDKYSQSLNIIVTEAQC